MIDYLLNFSDKRNFNLEDIFDEKFDLVLIYVLWMLSKIINLIPRLLTEGNFFGVLFEPYFFDQLGWLWRFLFLGLFAGLLRRNNDILTQIFVTLFFITVFSLYNGILLTIVEKDVWLILYIPAFFVSGMFLATITFIPFLLLNSAIRNRIDKNAENENENGNYNTHAYGGDSGFPK